MGPGLLKEPSRTAPWSPLYPNVFRLWYSSCFGPLLRFSCVVCNQEWYVDTIVSADSFWEHIKNSFDPHLHDSEADELEQNWLRLCGAR